MPVVQEAMLMVICGFAHTFADCDHVTVPGVLPALTMAPRICAWICTGAPVNFA